MSADTRTPEEILDPDLPICDPHHHLWDYRESMYLVDEFLLDADSGHNVTKTVYVECRRKYRDSGEELLRPVGETEFIEQLVSQRHSGTARVDVAAAIVGFADLSAGDEVVRALEAHIEASERFRGIRHMSAWDASDGIRNAQTNPPAGLLACEQFRKGFSKLSGLGLSFDAWVYHPQIPELAGLARAFPETRIVLNHIGGPVGTGPYAGRRQEVYQVWKSGMETLVDCENIAVKLGGLTMGLCGFGWNKREPKPGSRELAQAMGPWYNACIDLFGPGRCMFESNFPIDKVSCSYRVLWNAFKLICSDYSDSERAALFHDTAATVYRL